MDYCGSTCHCWFFTLIRSELTNYYLLAQVVTFPWNLLCRIRYSADHVVQISLLFSVCVVYFRLTWLLWMFRVICWSGIPLMVFVWENKIVWWKRPCCKTLHCSPPISLRHTCRNFSCGRLLASFYGCNCWIITYF